MNLQQLRGFLQDVQAGRTSLAAAEEELRSLPFEDLGFAKLDHHRELRQGVLAEVVYAEPKRVEDLVKIVLAIWSRQGAVLASRVTEEQATVLTDALPEGHWDAVARTFRARREPCRTTGTVVVITAGTSDRGVAGEVVNTLAHFGCDPVLLEDCGLAGLHRLLAQRPALEAADVVVVVAGMEGALPTAVAGLVGAPVIGVPTSVGYGAAQGGFAALVGMLSSCAQGVTVTNIDNGFGAACAALRCLALRGVEPKPG